jgi:uncharacterized protein (DUF1330 family)
MTSPLSLLRGWQEYRLAAVGRAAKGAKAVISSTGRIAEEHMAAYLIVEHIITDAAKFEDYRTKAAPMIARHGGRYLTKGGSHTFPEGGHWKPERVVIIEFPDMASLDRWYSSPEYQALIALRKACTSDLDMMITLESA